LKERVREGRNSQADCGARADRQAPGHDALPVKPSRASPPCRKGHGENGGQFFGLESWAGQIVPIASKIGQADV
jgi:hypothetical protein